MVKPENLISTLQNTSDSSKVVSGNYSEADFLTFDDDVTVPDLLPAATAGVDFLVTHFPRILFTFQFFRDNKPGPTLNLPAKNKAIILEELLKKSRSGYDVYFMVNEGNGVTPEGKKSSRCKDAVVSFSYCFIDTDNCPIAKVTSYLQSINLEPTFTIESSANRFHIYFKIEECEKTFKNIQTWLSIQGMLARLGDPAATKENSADTQMADYSRLLRVPGFTHQRKKFVSTVVSTSTAAYTLADLYDITNAKEFEEYNLQNYGKLVPVHVPAIGDVIENGMRFEAARSYSMSLANKPVTYEEKLNLYTQFISTFDNTDPEFYANGQLTAKSLDLFNTANKKVEIETRSTYDLITTTAPAISFPTVHTPKPSWVLPADFYTSAPNGLGEATKEIMRYSKYPSAQLAFSAILGGVSVMKASRYLTRSGGPCSFYVLIVAESGYGKHDPIAIVKKSLIKYGYGAHIFTAPRSKEGTINFLSKHQSFGISIDEEMGEFLIDLTTKKDNVTYQQLDAFLKSISTSCEEELQSAYLTDTAKKKGPPPTTLRYPVLSILASTTPALAERSFNVESLTGGLYQRFTIAMIDFEDLMPNPNANSQVSITCDVFESMRQTPQVPPLTTELDDTGKGEKLGATEDLAYRPPPTVMPATPAALARMHELDCYYRDVYNKYYKNPDTRAIHSLYSRVAEKIERLATVISLERITLDDLDFAQKYVESLTAQQVEAATSTVLSNDKGRKAMADEERVMTVLKNAVKKASSNIVPRSDVYNSSRPGRFSSVMDFDRVIASLVALGKIEEGTIKEPGKKNVKALVLK